MNDYSKTYFHLDKSESLIAKKRMNTENQTEIKLEKYKKVPKIKDNLSIKHRLLKKMSQQNTLILILILNLCIIRIKKMIIFRGHKILEIKKIF